MCAVPQQAGAALGAQAGLAAAQAKAAGGVAHVMRVTVAVVPLQGSCTCAAPYEVMVCLTMEISETLAWTPKSQETFAQVAKGSQACRLAVT